MKFFTEYKSCYGLAIDIGTTVVEMQLIDLENDMIIADYKKKNTQNIYGADIVSRINYAQSKIDGLARLQRRIIDMLNYMIKNIVENINIDRNMIGKTVIVGNYAMTSLFLGIPPEEISKIPSERCMQDEIVIDSEKIGLDISKSGKIIVLPGIAGFIGSDTMGVLLSTKLYSINGGNSINLIIDLGTNSEIILIGKGRIIMCSTAAGPAFEGAEIKCGIQAGAGSIERVSITTDVELKVISNERPIGICGSGLIDIVAEMLKMGIIDSSGRFTNDKNKIDKLPPSVKGRLNIDSENKEFIIAYSSQTASEEDIVITQKDIRKFQLAKGAILGAIRTLTDEMGVSVNEIDKYFLAGAFGNYINIKNAQRIGLIPLVSNSKVITIGNAAIDGARVAILSKDEQKWASDMAGKIEYIDLTANKKYNKKFLESLRLP